MIEWLKQFTGGGYFSWQNIAIGVVLFVITFAGSIGMVTFLLVKLPPDYFHPSHQREFMTDRHRAVRWSGIVLKNLFGLFLVLFGIALAVPGVPGQGLLTILLGIMFLDFPGKRRLELKVVSRPKILKSINELRAKFGKPALVLE